MINEITTEQKERLERKFLQFDEAARNVKHELAPLVPGAMKDDPSLFAYFHFTDPETKEPWKVYPWQDLYLNDKSPRKQVVCARQIGKSTGIGIEAIHYAYYNDEALGVIISGTKDQATEVIRRIRSFLNNSRWQGWKDSVERKKEIQIRNLNKRTWSRIIISPASDYGKGYSPNKVWVDEAAIVENCKYLMEDVVLPSVSKTKGSISMLSSPLYESGYFYETYKKENYWTKFHFNWRFGLHNTQEYMNEERKNMSNDAFLRNFEAQFTSGEGNYFTPSEIDNAVFEEVKAYHLGQIPIPVGGVISCDFGKMVDPCVIHIGFVSNPQAPKNEHIVILAKRIAVPLGTNYADVLAALSGFIDTLHPSKVVLDATGVGESPSDILKIAYGENLIESIKFSLVSKEDIYSNLKILFQQRRIKIPPITDLINQLRDLRFEQAGTIDVRGNVINTSRHIKIFAPPGQHDDDPDALALLAHGLVDKTPAVSIAIVRSGQVQLIKEAPISKGQTLYCESCDNYYWSNLVHEH